jgi:phosphatidylglycerol---prolipoprotein diacylglyceryl transferase
MLTDGRNDWVAATSRVAVEPASDAVALPGGTHATGKIEEETATRGNKPRRELTEGISITAPARHGMHDLLLLCMRKPGMHPILVRIPLPHGPLKLWWGLVAITVLAFGFAAWSQRIKDRAGVLSGGFVGFAAGLGSYFWRDVSFDSPALPLYSYGVMLGLSLVVGWYLTLTLAKKDGLPQETMANCYVVTALAAIVGSRVLYVLTNLDEFHSVADMFKVRLGGLVAYGGFLGGYLGSWAFLKSKRINLLPWADVAVPSLASGLMITRIGCYLFGCDFGKRLPDGAPHWLKAMGTFPHWAAGTVESGDGSPAFIRHMEIFKDGPLHAELTHANASLPVHPTQIYESLVGLVLLGLLLWQRRSQRFRGQIFFLFVFGYGYLRFLLEILRDDVERGEYGPVMPEHILLPGALLLMSVAFIFGIANGIPNQAARLVARIASLVPPLVTYIALKPPSFGASVSMQLSTSQWIGFLTALAVSFFYAQYWDVAQKQPKLAMSVETLGPGAVEELAREEKEKKLAAGEEKEKEEDEADDDGSLEGKLSETKAEAPRPKHRKGERQAEEEPESKPEGDPAGKQTPAPEG